MPLLVHCSSIMATIKGVKLVMRLYIFYNFKSILEKIKMNLEVAIILILSSYSTNKSSIN